MLARMSQTSPTLSPASPGQPAASTRRWWTLVTVALAQLMVVLDSTVVNIALPSAQADLGFDNADRQWIVTAYSLAFGSLLLFGGRLSDRSVDRVVRETSQAIGETDADLIRWTQGPEVAQRLSSRFSAHSLRSGFATAAAEEEASLKKIMEQTGHQSSDVALRYIRHADRWRDNPTERLFRRKPDAD